MKTFSKLLLTSAAIGAATWLVAQDNPPQGGSNRPPVGQQGGPGGQGGQRPAGGRSGFGSAPGAQRPSMPLIDALDANHDHVIDAQEIANASAALKKLDKNGDGKLTPDEFLGFRPGGQGGGGQGGQGGFGRPGGQGGQGGQNQGQRQRPGADQ